MRDFGVGTTIQYGALLTAVGRIPIQPVPNKKLLPDMRTPARVFSKANCLKLNLKLLPLTSRSPISNRNFLSVRASAARPIPPAPAAGRPFLFSKITGAGDRWPQAIAPPS
jgi:hypothetical protein